MGSNGSQTLDRLSYEIVTQTNWLLENRNSVVPSYQLMLFTDAGLAHSQDFITAVIPEPSSFALLGLGLAMGAIARKKYNG